MIGFAFVGGGGSKSDVMSGSQNVDKESEVCVSCDEDNLWSACRQRLCHALSAPVVSGRALDFEFHRNVTARFELCVARYLLLIGMIRCGSYRV